MRFVFFHPDQDNEPDPPVLDCKLKPAAVPLVLALIPEGVSNSSL